MSGQQPLDDFTFTFDLLVRTLGGDGVVDGIGVRPEPLPEAKGATTRHFSAAVAAFCALAFIPALAALLRQPFLYHRYFSAMAKASL